MNIESFDPAQDRHGNAKHERMPEYRSKQKQWWSNRGKKCKSLTLLNEGQRPEILGIVAFSGKLTLTSPDTMADADHSPIRLNGGGSSAYAGIWAGFGLPAEIVIPPGLEFWAVFSG